MTIYLKQSTASQEVPLGYFVDSTDGNTEETGLTIANTDVKVWKTGATTLANKNSGGATHISNGIYYATLDATDTDTLGPLVLFVHVAGALAVRLECCVLAANVFDSLIGGGDLLQVDVSQVGGTAQTAGDIIGDTNDIQARLPAALVSGRIDASVGAMAANTLTASAVAADAVTELQAGLATSAALATVTGYIDTEVADIQARLPAALVGGRMDCSVGAMGANVVTASAVAADAVAEIQSGLSTLDAAGVRAAVGLASANLDTQLGTIDGNVDAIKAKTDSLNFTVAGIVDSNVQYVNDVQIQGNGQPGTEWGPI